MSLVDTLTVTIGSAGSTITFERGPQPGDVVELLGVTVRGKDLCAGRQVYEGYDFGFESLSRYFAGLADAWRGWSGGRTYESLEGDLYIVATHNGRVHLEVRLAQFTVVDGWRVQTHLTIDAGEELSQAARDLADLVTGA
jgi:hypothetical protein